MVRVVLLIGGIVFLLDQYTKYQVLQILQDRGPIYLIPGLLRLNFVANTGVAFGLLPNAGGWLTLFALIAIGALLLMSLQQESSLPIKFALGLQMGGALGNLVDRLHKGYVVDFFDLYIGGRSRWPTFNLADVAITLGALGLLVYGLCGLLSRKSAP